ncbi:MAG: CaiB/BaiF CoA transferase family protein [Pseudomonadales bacterium]
MSSPLQDLRVLDLSRVLAGPFAGRMLADLGADVVKVEPPAGDVTRLWGSKRHGISGYFNQQNAGKRGICVDLGVSAGVELVKALAAAADIVIENFRPDVMGRLGLGYPVLAAANPGLIMLSISGFGANGPESRRAAYAPIIHAESGIMARQAEVSGSHPVDMALSVADTNAALHGLVAVLAALHLRGHTGAGQHIDMAMIDATLVTDDHVHFALDDAHELKNMPSEVWRSAAGPIVIAGDFRFLWRQLNTIMGVQDGTPDGAPLAEKISARRAAVRHFLEHECGDRAAVIAAMEKMNVAWGDVRTSTQALDLSAVGHRQTFTAVDDRGGGTRRVPQSPYRFSAASAFVRGGAPHQGEHNQRVLEDWLGPEVGRAERWADALVAAKDPER